MPILALTAGLERLEVTVEYAALFGAGLLTFLSPCVLPLVPLYLSFLSGASVAELRSGGKGRGLVWMGVAFSLGLAAVFVALGMAASVVGSALSAHRDRLLPVAGALVLLFGLKLLGVVQIPFLDREVRPGMSRTRRGTGLFAAFGLGGAFALGWTPCVGPVLGTALAFAASSSSGAFESAAMLGVFAAGLTAPLIAVAALGPIALRALDRFKPQVGKFEKLTGAALAVVAVLMLTGSLNALGEVSLGDEAPAAQATVVTEPPTPAAAVAPDEVDGAPGEPLTPAIAASLPPAEGEAVACEAGSGTGTACELPEGPMSQPELLASVPERAGPKLVQFTSKTCPVCERMAPVVAQVQAKCGAQLLQDHVDVGTSPGRAEARARGVVGVPTYVFLGRDGQEVSRLIGERPAFELQASLETALGTRCGS